MAAVIVGLWLALFAPAVPAAQSDVDHGPWDYLMRRYVTPRGVDYEGLRADQAAVEQYLAALSAVEVDALPSAEAKLAFWINAYNANVVKGVLDHSPIASVKEVKGFFDRLRYRVAGRELTLNEIEGEGRALGDWRVHFAVVCASSSCPPLRAEAYVADRLDAQLADQTRQFLGDPQRGIRVEGTMLWLSRIFDWYQTDFLPATERGRSRRLTAEQLLPLIAPYLDLRVAHTIKSRRLSIRFLKYDWSLNEQH